MKQHNIYVCVHNDCVQDIALEENSNLPRCCNSTMEMQCGYDHVALPVADLLCKQWNLLTAL